MRVGARGRGVSRLELLVTLGVVCALTMLLVRGYRRPRPDDTPPPRLVYTPIAPLPTPVLGPGVAAVGDLIYVIGGNTVAGEATDLVQAYNTRTDQWDERRARVLTPRAGLGAAALGTDIYAVGGYAGPRSLATVEVYHTAEDRWDPGPDLPAANTYGDGVKACAERIYAIGGYTSEHGCSDQVYSLDPARLKLGWQHATSKPAAAAAFAALVEYTWICCLGGHTGGQLGVCLRDVDAYDALGGRWDSRLPLLPTALTACTGAALHHTYYVFGGGQYDKHQVQPTVLRLCPGRKAWEHDTDLPNPRRQMAAVTVGESIYLIGGDGPGRERGECWRARPGPSREAGRTAAP